MPHVLFPFADFALYSFIVKTIAMKAPKHCILWELLANTESEGGPQDLPTQLSSKYFWKSLWENMKKYTVAWANKYWQVAGKSRLLILGSESSNYWRCCHWRTEMKAQSMLIKQTPVYLSLVIPNHKIEILKENQPLCEKVVEDHLVDLE